MTDSSSNGDLLNTDEVLCRYGIGRVVTSTFTSEQNTSSLTTHALTWSARSLSCTTDYSHSPL